MTKIAFSQKAPTLQTSDIYFQNNAESENVEKFSQTFFAWNTDWRGVLCQYINQ